MTNKAVTFPSPEGLEIVAPTEAQIPYLQTLWQEAFGDPKEAVEDFFEVAYDSRRSLCATVEGLPVAALYWLDAEYEGRRLAYLYAIATAKAHRGRGICGALMETAHVRLRKEGYAAAMLKPEGEGLFSFYRRFGYETACHIGEIQVKAEPSELILRRLTSKEYEEERRRFLPRGGVLQEGATIELLSRGATLYGGDGFLLALTEREGEPFGLELLGDVSLASGILYRLGATSGSFRIVGHDRPFVMLRSLGEELLSPPQYFGLTLDL